MDNEDEDCQHKHWVITNVRTRYTLPDNHGDLVEVSDHICKDCGFVKTNSVIIPPDYFSWAI